VARLALFGLLTALHTWPLVLAPAVLTRYDNADAQLNTWILAWVAHVLPRDPLHLFQANIFFPERDTLAYSEHLLVPALVGAPAAWLGAGPALVHNLVLMAGLTFTGWAVCHVVTRWTGDGWAGVLAGSLAAFNAHTLTRLPHVQAMHVEFLPMALLALDGVLRHARTRDALRLAGWFTLQALCSGYLLGLAAVAMLAGAAARPREWLGRRFVPVAGRLALAAGLSVLLLLPLLIPYARARAEQGLTRPVEEVALYSAKPRDYVTTVSRVHFGLWSRRFYEANDALFPGVIAVALAGVAMATGRAWRDARARMLLAIGLLGFALSFGPALPFYRWLHEHVPLLQGIRGAARFGYLALLAIAGLAAFGLAGVRARCRATGRGQLAFGLSLACLAGVHIEALVAPVEYMTFAGVPPIYRALREAGNAVVVEVPIPPADRIVRNAPVVLATTAHWRPVVNGYSGFVPRGYAERADRIGTFPAPTALDELRRLGVTHVVVNLGEAPELADQLASMPEFVTVATGHPRRIYRLRTLPKS
jgi:hypothetical protein